MLCCATHGVCLQVAAAKVELLQELEGWGDKVKLAAGDAAEQRVKAGSEVRGLAIGGALCEGPSVAAVCLQAVNPTTPGSGLLQSVHGRQACA